MRRKDMKKKSLLKMSSLALALALVFAGCGQSGNSDPGASGSGKSDSGSKGGELKEIVLAKESSRELETFNMLYSQKNQDFENLTNVWDGLLEVDSEGKLVPEIGRAHV